jgi:hypothetical protein
MTVASSTRRGSWLEDGSDIASVIKAARDKAKQAAKPKPNITKRRLSLPQIAGGLAADAYTSWEHMLEELERASKEAYMMLEERFEGKKNCAEVLSLLNKHGS